ncbi:MAG: hypothetical protein Q4F72_02130 [Desulfovibrionaceae bacterium]|nr:hypothetical protein [Desulfovibrionaceae bacterium]
MRYPMSGSLNRHREEYFYRMSQPAIFESVQNWRKEQFARSFRALNPEEPAYREKPRQRSPFRE